MLRPGRIAFIDDYHLHFGKRRALRACARTGSVEYHSCCFKKFGTRLQSAIQENLSGLASSDPQTQQHATDQVEKDVHQAVHDAIRNGLTGVEKAMIRDGQIKLDSEIATAYQVFRNPPPKQQFTVTLGDLYQGRLLFYRDETQDGSGLVAGPKVIGDSGWGEFKFLFSGGNGIIYAGEQNPTHGYQIPGTLQVTNS